MRGTLQYQVGNPEGLEVQVDRELHRVGIATGEIPHQGDAGGLRGRHHPSVTVREGSLGEVARQERILVPRVATGLEDHQTRLVATDEVSRPAVPVRLREPGMRTAPAPFADLVTRDVDDLLAEMELADDVVGATGVVAVTVDDQDATDERIGRERLP